MIDCRIIAATNESVETLIEQGEFRKDLFYRLNVLPITIPSLRERREDILLLADEFLQFEIESLNIDNRTFSSNCYTVLRHYSWPGNIRELKNVIKRAVVLSHGQSIEPESLGIEVDTLFTVKDHKEMRSEMLEQVIRSHKFNMTAVARTLNISRPTLYRLIKKHNIQLDS
ncbi:sigma-54-dependent Fis family transcriptional regulator [Vibrio mediterranei]|nr:sigma-54-dependent Fis family transcriptional regulator [Vibrio mediterranei]